MERRFGFLADWVLALRGVGTDAASRQKLLEQVDSAVTDAAWKLKRNAAGDYRPDANAERFPQWESRSTSGGNGRATGLAFDDLFERWRRETDPAANTVATFRGH